MKVRRNVSRPDTSAWPEFDPGALTAAQRKTFGARRRAVEMFVADTSLAEIEAQTGVNRRQVYRAPESATALHADGRPYGWRALVHLLRCGGCGADPVSYNSCRNRYIPECQSSAAQRWLNARHADLLPVEYCHAIFTLPAPMADIACQNKAVVYGLLFD